jgi:hypothetical protein
MTLDLFGYKASYVWEFGFICQVTGTDETISTLVEGGVPVI